MFLSVLYFKSRTFHCSFLKYSPSYTIKTQVFEISGNEIALEIYIAIKSQKLLMQKNNCRGHFCFRIMSTSLLLYLPESNNSLLLWHYFQGPFLL
jgi:hypothetical protein